MQAKGLPGAVAKPRTRGIPLNAGLGRGVCMRQVSGDSSFKQSNEIGIHKLIPIGDVQANDSLTLKVWLEIGGKLATVFALHDKY
jgi:hypothetical protein